MTDEVFDHRGFIARRNVLAAMPALLDMSRRHRQHVPFPNPGGKPHPGVCGIFRRVWTPIHPDCPVLFVCVDVFVNCDELESDGIALLPEAGLQRSSMNVLD